MNIERSCRSKQTYLSKADAKRVVRLMGARYGEAFNLYACEICRYWHIGHLIPSYLRARVVPAWERRAVRLSA